MANASTLEYLRGAAKQLLTNTYQRMHETFAPPDCWRVVQIHHRGSVFRCNETLGGQAASCDGQRYGANHDGLRHPTHVGGITEVGKGMWMKREALNVERLVEYACRLGAGVVFRRLGYLLERYEMANASTLEYLRLQLNVPPEEIDAVRFG